MFGKCYELLVERRRYQYLVSESLLKYVHLKKPYQWFKW